MDRAQILAEIVRTATANGGSPLGVARFYAETGVKETDWRGRYWARWGDALREAGFEPNRLQESYETSEVVRRLAELTRELGHFPTSAEIKLKRRQDSSFPSLGVHTRLGKRQALVEAVRAFAAGTPEFESLVALLPASVPVADQSSVAPAAQPEDGTVYLLRVGKHYKIGRTNALGRRERELAIQLPERAVTVHAIRTDDPAGIEAYWHNRFSSARRNGEWFELSSAEVKAFKRRKFM